MRRSKAELMKSLMLVVKPLKEEKGEPSGRDPRRRYAALFTWCTHSDTNSSFSTTRAHYYALNYHSKLVNYTFDLKLVKTQIIIDNSKFH